MSFKKFMAFGLMVLIVAALAAADIVIVHRSYLRTEVVIAQLEALVGRPVRLGSVDFGPISGFVAEGFEIRHRDERPFLSAQKIRIQIDTPRLLQGQVAISDIELVGPSVSMEINKDGRSELFDLVTEVVKRAEGEGSKGGPIPRIHIRKGSMVFSYAAIMPEGKSVQATNVDVNILPYGANEFVVDGSLDAGELGKWTIDGKIDTTTGRSEVRLTAKGMPVSPATIASFGAEVTRIYNMYKAVGTIDASAIFVSDPREEKPLRVVADVTARGLSIEYGNFPYQVVNVEGLIRLKDDGIEFQGMSARMWPLPDDTVSRIPVPGVEPIEVTMSGMTDGYVGESAYDLDFGIRGLPLTPKLRAALLTDAGNIYDMFSPTGRLSGTVRVNKPHGKGLPIVHNIEMDLAGVRATFKPFPLPIEEATGHIRLKGEELFIENARCRNKEAWFTVNGHLTSIEADGGIEVTVDTDGVALGADARAALPIEVRKIWDHFAPAGSIAMHWVTRREPGPDKPLTYDVTVKPLGIKATYDGVPYPLTDVRGEVWTDTKVVKVVRLTGKKEGARVEIKGEVTGVDATPAYDLTINGEEIPVDGTLRAALPGTFSDLIEAMKMKGVLKVEKLRFRMGGADLPPGTSKYDAKAITLYEGAFDAGLDFRECLLELGTIDGAITPTDHRLFAHIQNTTIRVEDFKVKELSGDVTFLKNQLQIESLNGTCYDGRITGKVFYNLEDSKWLVDLKISDVDLLELTRDTSMKGKNITGKTAGDIRMEGIGGDGGTYHGSGALSLRKSELWDVPLLARLLNVIRFGKKDVFDKGFIRFNVKDKAFRVKDMLLESDSLNLICRKGNLDFDGNLKLKLSPKMKGGFVNPILGPIIQGVMAIYVSGPFSDPTVETRPTADFEEIFRNDPDEGDEDK